MQQGEAAPGRRGCASERPTGFSVESKTKKGKDSHPSLTSVCFLLTVETKEDNPLIRMDLGEKEEDNHEMPPPFSTAS